MKNLIIFGTFLVFLGCNNSDKSTTTEHDSTNTKSDSMHDTTSQTASQQLGDAMNRMMEEMKTMQLTGDPDNDFAMMMKRHHIAAIEMANTEIASGKDSELKAMAQKMIDAQQKEINEFNNLLSSHNPHSKTDFGEKSKQMMEKSSAMPMTMHGADIDLDFATMMIQHHQHAIDMSKEYLKTAHEPTIKTIAQNIISSQQKEIQELNDWKGKHNPGAH